MREMAVIIQLIVKGIHQGRKCTADFPICRDYRITFIQL
jgi:hypothetical protein